MPFAPHILDVSVPDVMPQGAPGNDYERIQATPDMFGGLIARSEERLGQGISQAGDAAFNYLMETDRLQDQIHGSELHSWFSDQAGDAISKFSELQGRAAVDGLPGVKKQIADLQQQAVQQSGNLFTQSLVAQNTRRTMDYLYGMATRHADTQRTAWATHTATNNIDSATNGGSLAITSGGAPLDMARLDQQMNVINAEAHNAIDAQGYDPDTAADAVSKFKGKALTNWVETAATNDKDPDALTHALAIYHRYQDQADPASRLTISKYLNAKTFNRTVDRLANYYVTGDVANLGGSFVQSIKNSEGYRDKPYWDVKQWSVGYGTKASGPDERPDRFTLEGRFDDELTRAANFVDSVNPHLDPGTRAALTSLTYNAGEGWASAGLGEAVRDNDLLRAQQLFLQYNRSGGQPSANLSQRRAAEAQWFGQTQAPGVSPRDTSAMVDRVRTDPAFADRPELQAAVEKAIVAKSAMAERADALTARAQKDASDSSELKFFQNIHSGKPTVTLDQIMADPSMSREAKERMVTQLETATGAEKADKTYGTGFYDLYRRVHLPETDPQHISDPGLLYGHVGPTGDLTVAGVDKLVQEIQGKRTPEGVAEGEMKKQFLANARAQITGTDEGLHIKDPKGDELYLKFLAQALPQYDKLRREGKSAAALLDPSSPDYLGKMISGYKRPMSQWYSDMVHDQGEGTAAQAPGGFDPSKVNSLDDLVAAYRRGDVDKDTADSIAIAKGWGYRKPPPPQVPFSAQ